MTKTQMSPLERFLALPGVQQAKPFSRGWRMRCPVHDDHEESLQFWEDETDGHVGIQCFVNCRRADICEALGIREADLYAGGRAPKPSSSPPRKLDLLDLALHKCIHPGLLLSLGIEDGYTWTHPEGRQVKGLVKIPYFLEDGTPYLRNRIRTAVTAKLGSYWEGAEAPLIPYGLWKLKEARAQKTLWLVEGESDCWTHWLHGIPALGIPGVSSTAVLQAAHLQDIETLYIVQEPVEPGKTQDAGRVFVQGLTRRLRELGYRGAAYVVSLKRSHGVKDPNDLHQRLFAERRMREYPQELQKALHEAIPLDLQAATTPAVERLAELQPLVEAAIGEQNSASLYDLAPRLARLQTKDQETIITLIKQGMKQASGFSQRTFNKLLKEEQRQQSQQQHLHVSSKPDILLSGNLEQDAEQALQALYTANTPPMIFIRLGKLVRCRVTEEGRPFIEVLNESILLYELTRAANFLSYHQGRETYVPTYPPLAIARHILAQPRWNFPALRGVTEVPVIREDGTILDQPGYDAQTRLLYLPHPDLKLPPIPQQPTPQEIEEARDYAWSYLAEFPYESRADAANAFGLLLTTVTRSLYGPTPLAVIDATKQGSGKGLLTKLVAYVAQGRSAASTIPPSDENEWRKTLTAQLLEGNMLISLDNVEGLLYSATLASFLTSDTWNARLLGTMQSPELPQRVMMMANGNNIQLGGDIPRRSYRIRMDAGVSQPWLRSGFTYSPLLKYVRENRGQIIAALLTIVRGWFVAGQPAPQQAIPSLADFTGWAQVIGGILAHAGVDGFLGNLAQLYEEVDTEGPQWARFLEAWLEKLGDSMKCYTTAQVIEALQQDKDFAATLPEPLAGLPLEDAKDLKAFSIRLGRALQKRQGTPYGAENVRLLKTHDDHAKQKLWSVTSHPMAEAKPIRLIWKQPIEACAATNSEEEKRAATAPDTTITSSEEKALKETRAYHPQGQQPVFSLPGTTVPRTCEAPDCLLSAAEPQELVTDTYGHAWCQRHADRKQILERGGLLAFPSLIHSRGRVLDAGRQAWEAFVRTAPQSAIADVLRAIENRELRERLNQTSQEHSA